MSNSANPRLIDPLAKHRTEAMANDVMANDVMTNDVITQERDYPMTKPALCAF